MIRSQHPPRLAAHPSNDLGTAVEPHLAGHPIDGDVRLMVREVVRVAGLVWIEGSADLPPARSHPKRDRIEEALSLPTASPTSGALADGRLVSCLSCLLRSARLPATGGRPREAYPGTGNIRWANPPFDVKMVRWRVSTNPLTGTAVLDHAPHCPSGSPKRSRTSKG